jgi:hypothetical protein
LLRSLPVLAECRSVLQQALCADPEVQALAHESMWPDRVRLTETVRGSLCNEGAGLAPTSTQGALNSWVAI